MVISDRLKSLSKSAIKAEIDMKIDEYHRLVRKMQTLCDGDPTEEILKDLRLTIAQSKILANRIYELRHKN